MTRTPKKPLPARLEVDPETGCWVVTVEGVPGEGFAQNLPRARELARSMAESDPRWPGGTVEAELILPLAVRRALTASEEARRRAEEAAREARAALGVALDTVAAEMPTLGIRDMGDLVGLSFGRIRQLRPGRPARGARPLPRATRS